MSYILSALKKIERRQQTNQSPSLLSVQIEPATENNSRSWLQPLLIGISVIAISASVTWYLSTQIITPDTNLTGSPKTSLTNDSRTQNTPSQAQPSANINPTEMTKASETPQTAPPSIPQNSEPSPAPTDESKTLNNPYLSVLRSGIGIPQFDELSDEVRSQIPRFDISGYLYSSLRPQANKVIVNGTALRAGQYISDDLQLKEIHSDYIIMNYKGLAFRLNSNQF